MEKLEAITRITETAIQNGVINFSKSNGTNEDLTKKANKFNTECLLSFIKTVSEEIEKIK